MTGIDVKINTYTDSPYCDCDAFLNWSEEKFSSEHECAVVFRSLVATVKFQPELNVSLEEKAVKFLESMIPMIRQGTDPFLRSLGRTADESSTNFVESVVVLLSSANQAITTAAMKMLGTLIRTCSAEVLLALVQADLISRLINTLNPQSLAFAEAVDIHISLMRIITESVWLAIPYGLAQLGIEDENEQQAVYETVFLQVITPSETYLCHLCVNRMEQFAGHEPSKTSIETDENQRTLRSVSGFFWTTNTIGLKTMMSRKADVSDSTDIADRDGLRREQTRSERRRFGNTRTWTCGGREAGACGPVEPAVGRAAVRHLNEHGVTDGTRIGEQGIADSFRG
ncbi:hypothetical protein BLNAU_7521 [Blattamonas nauphoetae]|uniref:Uncharacterized protein n=1 Tax=Blattamonas nauphoetae TaxID=2049346 RepID=A0ABQ9Y1K4_9EUKA|nr:hypothetical protein BLNAU_7521 [Blattamonas nauphoetae]